MNATFIIYGNEEKCHNMVIDEKLSRDGFKMQSAKVAESRNYIFTLDWTTGVCDHLLPISQFLFVPAYFEIHLSPATFLPGESSLNFSFNVAQLKGKL